jgi:hypothetical protein
MAVWFCETLDQFLPVFDKMEIFQDIIEGFRSLLQKYPIIRIMFGYENRRLETLIEVIHLASPPAR